MRIFFFSFFIFHFSLPGNAQQFAHKPENPVFILDSIRVNDLHLKDVNAENIAGLNVYKREEAIKLIGEDGRNGVIFIETKAFKKKKFWSMLSTINPEYKMLVPSPDADEGIRYIYPGKTIIERANSKIFSLKPEEIKEVQIIGFAEMKKKYGIEGKKGVLIIKK
ncbi:MAG: hypothetical protein ACXWV5_11345 [Flavitalea sp.]